jgi:MinD superfamily P-loop ATPase
MMAGSGYIAKIDHEKCINCGLCEKKCNFLAIYRDAEKKVQVNEDLCRGCEGCLTACKKGAITLELVDPDILAPLDIKALKAEMHVNA